MNVKTDWKITDTIDVKNDYQRIKSNILETYELIIQINPYVTLQTIPDYNAFTDVPHLQMYQAIENNIYNMNQLTFDLPYTKRDFPNFSINNLYIKNWDYNDLNRIESMVYLLYETAYNYIEQNIKYNILTETGYNLLTETGYKIRKEI